MPHGFVDIPDWFSAENQGAGVAILEEGADRSLVVLLVDHPGTTNRGLYRIGKKLDAAGRVTGGWMPWIEIPDWFSAENQGADLAIAAAPAGGHDLVVFAIDNPAGQNRGVFRIGRQLDQA